MIEIDVRPIIDKALRQIGLARSSKIEDAFLDIWTQNTSIPTKTMRRAFQGIWR